MAEVHPCAHCGSPLRRPPEYRYERVRVPSLGGKAEYVRYKVPNWSELFDDVVCGKCGLTNYIDFPAAPAGAGSDDGGAA